MKKYFDQKTILIFILLFSTAILFDLYLNSLGYEGILYFKTNVSENINKSHTGGILFIGISLVYLLSICKISYTFKDNILAKHAIDFILILGVTICIIGLLDLTSALSYLMGFY